MTDPGALAARAILFVQGRAASEYRECVIRSLAIPYDLDQPERVPPAARKKNGRARGPAATTSRSGARYSAGARAGVARAGPAAGAASAASISSKVRPLVSWPNTQKPTNPSTYQEAK